MTRKLRNIAGLGLAVLVAAAAYSATSGAPAFDPDRYLGHIKFLASPEMRGRESGSPELEKAAQYIAAQFRADGLKPVDGKSYLQPFEVTTMAKMGRANRFELQGRFGLRDAPGNQGIHPIQFFLSWQSLRRGGLRRLRDHRARVQL